MAHAVDADCLFEYARIAAEPPLPQAMTQNYYPIAMRRFFFSGGLRHVLFLREEATHRRPDSEHREEIGGYQVDINLFGRSLATERSRIENSERGQLFEDMA